MFVPADKISLPFPFATVRESETSTLYVARFKNTRILIGQYDVMKSHGCVGTFRYKLAAILIGNSPSADNEAGVYCRKTYLRHVLR